jgi:hypothetical protein
MWQTITLSFLGGLVAGNGLPHFIRGITKRPYPSALGNGPLPNLIAGWLGLVLGTALLWWSNIPAHPTAAFAATATGLLLIGLFHAGPGAFGRKEQSHP